MIAGAIFDMDGVLLDSMGIWEHAGEKYLHTLGVKVERNLGRVLDSMSMQEGSVYLQKQYQLDKKFDLEIPAIIEGINQVIEDFYLYEVGTKSGVTAFLSRLEQDQIPMVVATSTDRHLAEAALLRNGLHHFFEGIFTCSEIGKGKTEPDIYQAAAGSMGTSAEETWVFEDADYAIETARRAGFPVVGIYEAVYEEKQKHVEEMSSLYIRSFTNCAAIYPMIKG